MNAMLCLAKWGIVDDDFATKQASKQAKIKKRHKHQLF